MSDAELITDEMLSAYLDGELSEAERIRVDERLEHDEKAQRTVEELRGIREEIRRLPQQALSAGFASQITDQISAPSKAESRPGISERSSNRSRARLAAILAAVAALFLISIWGINYLPSLNLAKRPTKSDHEAENTTADQPLAEVVEKLDEPVVANGEALRLKQEMQPSLAARPQAERGTNRSLSRVTEAASDSDNSVFGLIVDYQVDAKQLREISSAWSQYKTTSQGNQNSQVSEFVIAGTPGQITSLLAGVRAQSSDIRGELMPEFKRLGLSFFEERRVLDETPAPSPTEVSIETRSIEELPAADVERLSKTTRQRSISAPTANSGTTRSRFSVNKAADKASGQVSEAVVESPDAPVIRVLVRFEQVD